MRGHKVQRGVNLLVIGGINEVPARIEICVKEFERQFLVHGSHAELGPFVADAHTTKGQRGYVDTGFGGQETISA
jgi:hypothetical protein